MARKKKPSLSFEVPEPVRASRSAGWVYRSEGAVDAEVDSDARNGGEDQEPAAGKKAGMSTAPAPSQPTEENILVLGLRLLTLPVRFGLAMMLALLFGSRKGS